MTYEKIIERINQECKKRNISVYRLSQISSVPVSTLYGVLHQNNKAQMDTLCEILDALGLQMRIEAVSQCMQEERGSEWERIMEGLSDEKTETLKKLAEWMR